MSLRPEMSSSRSKSGFNRSTASRKPADVTAFGRSSALGAAADECARSHGSDTGGSTRTPRRFLRMSNKRASSNSTEGAFPLSYT